MELVRKHSLVPKIKNTYIFKDPEEKVLIFVEWIDPITMKRVTCTLYNKSGKTVHDTELIKKVQERVNNMK